MTWPPAAARARSPRDGPVSAILEDPGPAPAGDAGLGGVADAGEPGGAADLRRARRPPGASAAGLGDCRSGGVTGPPRAAPLVAPLRGWASSWARVTRGAAIGP